MRRGLFASLQRIYARLPETTCDNCARCCFESPGLFFVEHLSLLAHLRQQSRRRREELVRRALHELFFAWVDPQRQCIFLESSRCTLYERRPLACRLFGLVAPTEREQAEMEARLAAQEEAQRYARLGVVIPVEVAQRALVSCDRVRDKHGQPVRVDADALAAEVARLDEALLSREVVLHEFCFRSLPDRLGAALFGAETVEPMRLQLLRRAQQGEEIGDLSRQVWELVKDRSPKVV